LRRCVCCAVRHLFASAVQCDAIGGCAKRSRNAQYCHRGQFQLAARSTWETQLWWDGDLSTLPCTDLHMEGSHVSSQCLETGRADRMGHLCCHCAGIVHGMRWRCESQFKTALYAGGDLSVPGDGEICERRGTDHTDGDIEPYCAVGTTEESGMRTCSTISMPKPCSAGM